MQSRRYGFTLIELLVVIAIIAILAAILFPVFIKAKEKARQTTCINNMSQLCKAFRMYLDDYGRYPYMGNLDWWTNGRNIPDPSSPDGKRLFRGCMGDWIWFKGQPFNALNIYSITLGPNPWPFRIDPAQGSIWRYTNKSAKIFVCPSDRHSNDGKRTNYGGVGLSYGLNNNIQSADYGDTPAPNDTLVHPPAMESEIMRPTKTVLLADLGDGSLTDHDTIVKAAKPLGVEARCLCYDGNFRWWEYGPTAVHCGGQNWSFCDGHVRWLTLKQWNTLIFDRDGRPNPYRTNHIFGE